MPLRMCCQGPQLVLVRAPEQKEQKNKARMTRGTHPAPRPTLRPLPPAGVHAPAPHTCPH